MYARPLLATIAMLLLVGSAVPCHAAGLEVGVYLRTDGAASEPVLDAMRGELNAILNRAGFHLKWWSVHSRGPIEAPEMIVVDLRGACRVPQLPAATRIVSEALQLELASTSTVDKQILPFTSLDCENFSRLLSGSLWHLDSENRDFVYGRALARVLAHEFYHVLAATHKHTARGLAKRAYSAADLTAQHFGFDAVAMSRLVAASGGSKSGSRALTAAANSAESAAPSDAPAVAAEAALAGRQ